jgi:hypothetical protein
MGCRSLKEERHEARSTRSREMVVEHFGSSPNNTAIIGDLDEKRRAGCSRAWYWRQVAVAIIVSMVKDTWTHKLLALRALIVGWFVFWFLYGGLINYALQVFATVTESLCRLRVIPLEGQLYCLQAFCTLGIWIVGIVSGWIVGRLHRRKVSLVLLHAVTVLVDWIVLGLTKRPESVGVSAQYFWMNIAILTVGIVLGGLLCGSRPEPTNLLHTGVSA